ncbi:hypothetical protein Taro_023200 [Colocasia esculenta]|uniref:Uncharacterized protein n=1 Tax=Colocasia esculenta TaxID=4460 RepID=A0A843VDS2_COLES|nr:hypothetical protein [Colocasia esculenta]
MTIVNQEFPFTKNYDGNIFRNTAELLLFSRPKRGKSESRHQPLREATSPVQSKHLLGHRRCPCGHVLVAELLAVVCVLVLADSPPCSFGKCVVRALCLLGLSWLQASCIICLLWLPRLFPVRPVLGVEDPFRLPAVSPLSTVDVLRVFADVTGLLLATMDCWLTWLTPRLTGLTEEETKKTRDERRGL